MKAILIRTIEDNIKKIFFYSIISILFIIMYAGMYPAIQEQAESLNDLVSAYPEGFLKAFGIEDLLFDTFSRFLALEHFSIIWPLLMLLLGINLANSIFSKEYENSVMRLLLSQPITRFQLFFSKFLSGIILLVLFNSVSIFTIQPIAYIFGSSIDFKSITSIFILSLLFLITIFSITVLFSVTTQKSSKTSTFSSGIFLTMYAMNIAASIQPDFEGLKYGSFFFYFDYKEALNNFHIEMNTVWIFLITSILCFIISVRIFVKKDL